MSRHDTSAERTRYERKAQIDKRIRYILRAIESDPSTDVAPLAAMVNLSPSRLSHLFKRETRQSLHSFLANHRLEKAAQLLAGTPTQ
jgi:AraC family transcriptional regulator, arabinose operon regulatory protein